MDRVEREEKRVMLPFDKCPVCGGDNVEKEVEKLLKVVKIRQHSP
jgi:Zn-finger nucleic acid-binding protein